MTKKAKNDKNMEERRKRIVAPNYDAIMNTKDVFERYRVAVREALDLHQRARKIANLKDNGLTDSINRKAMPFVKGNFTLAVVGKMSAGKSTFLNALLGTSHLLPTGFLQTTCAITIVEHSDTPHIIVQYGDGHEVKITSDLGANLRKHVAIPDEYNDLPVNQINRLILAGKTKKEILSQKTINELECIAKCEVKPDILKKYVEERSKSNIPALVQVYTQMPEGYKGWRIVDTPGVDAIGGIEDDTKNFLCGKDKDGNNNVDAIIFIQKGSGNIQDSGLNEFVEDTINGLVDEAKKRVFFVLTHGGMSEFRNHRDEVVKMAKKLFVEKGNIAIDDDRLVVVDSLSEVLHKDLVDNCEDVLKYLSNKVPGPSRWNEVEWKDCRSVLYDVENILRRELEEDVLNESMLEQLKKLANFDGLRDKLSVFAAKEKKKTFDNLIDTIIQDISDCIKIRKKDIKVWEISLGSSPAEYRKKLEAEKAKLDDFQIEMNKFIGQIQTKYGKDKVSQRFRTDKLNDNFLTSLRSKKTKVAMIRYADDIVKEATNIQKRLIKEIEEQVSGYIDQTKLKCDVQFSSIDFSQIEHEADEKAYESKAVKESGIGGWLKRGIGSIFNFKWGYVYEVEHNPEKAREEFAILANGEIIKSLRLYTDAVVNKLDGIVISVDKAVKDKIAKSKEHYDALAKRSDLAKSIEEMSLATNAMTDYKTESEAFKKLKIEEL